MLYEERIRSVLWCDVREEIVLWFHTTHPFRISTDTTDANNIAWTREKVLSLEVYIEEGQEWFFAIDDDFLGSWKIFQKEKPIWKQLYEANSDREERDVAVELRWKLLKQILCLRTKMNENYHVSSLETKVYREIKGMMDLLES